MKRTSVVVAVLTLTALVSACSSSPDKSCETVSEDVVRAIMAGMQPGSVITGEAAGIRDGDWWNVAGAVDTAATDDQVGVWRVRQAPSDLAAIGPISSADLVAASISDWPSNLLESDVVDRASSCISV